MILGKAPNKRVQKTLEMFWDLVTGLRHHPEDSAEVNVAALKLSQYMVNHGGYVRLQETLVYLAKSVAINSLVDKDC